MKQSSNNQVVDICKELAENASRLEAETLATTFNEKTFRAVDLWSIQRQRKQRTKKSLAGLAYM